MKIEKDARNEAVDKAMKLLQSADPLCPTQDILEEIFNAGVEWCKRDFSYYYWCAINGETPEFNEEMEKIIKETE